MRPALSVVAFTVLSGAGVGALAILAIVELLGTATHRPLLSPLALQRTAVVALVLVVGGLCASTLHLGNRRNAWRSLSRLRSSWLSREAAAALALLAVVVLWMTTLMTAPRAAGGTVVALAVVVLSWLTLYCTAMIYASLKPIRQWHTPRVPLAYFALGHASGALVLVAVARLHGEPATALAIVAGVLLVAAAAVKLDYYAFIAGDAGRLTIEQAIGVPQGVRPRAPAGTRMRARLFDVGHSRGTFLTNEFAYTLAPAHRTALRLVVWIAGFVVPGLWLVTGLANPLAVAVACAGCVIGFGAERWLFFAEARHTVRLYHGDATT